ncbi:YncE family protein [Puniceibacterium sediminis]|uniref:40-residue YVTN family beta-propeller repeat-containing protein n=1 Tax=Puniceibacterium sediminis TaxID=1608407 RepID=A0A238ZH96_9RHOB|nr:hypothetical protein [Puniceibacterium sediminis]SNR82580.1 hypothetical protein SAMN06265370_13123 [Puniceibacterium sediminis]
MFHSTIRPTLLAILLSATAGAALAQDAFTGLDTGFSARLRAGLADGQGAITAGSTAEISAQNLKPGQTMTLRQNGAALADGQTFTADDKGELSAEIAIPAGTEAGTWPVVAEFGTPSFSTIVDVKVSPVLPELATDAFAMTSRQLEGGLYEVGYSAAQDALYVTSATGRGTSDFSALFKLDPETLDIIAQVSPPDAPAREDGRPAGVIGVFGLTVSDEENQIWVTNSRNNTVAVYDPADLSLIKQFESGMAKHARGVLVHDGKAYVGQVFTSEVAVFDTKSLEAAGAIKIESKLRGQTFGIGAIALDTGGNRLLVSSLASSEIAVIDLTSGEVTGVYPTPVKGAIGIAVDAAKNHAIVTGQDSDNIAVVDLATGETIQTVSMGANPLNALVDVSSGLTFVSVRMADRIIALDDAGKIVANLPTGSRPNAMATDGKGAIYLVNKAAGQNDDEGNQITRITKVD